MPKNKDLISRKALLKELRKEFRECEKDGEENGGEAVLLAEGLESAIYTVEDFPAAQIETPHPWTRCSQKTPLPGEVVEVTVKDGNDRYTCEAYIHSISGRWLLSTGGSPFIDGKVIAWRPKSEPYQGEE
jgi:hypothetical protein